MFKKKSACAMLLLLISVTSFAGELVVIVSAKNPNRSLLAHQVANIFLARSGTFPKGGAAVAIDQAIGTTARDDFYNKVTFKSPALVKAYWTKMIFTGRGQPPKEVMGDGAVMKLVAANPELIGYIDHEAIDDTVRAVLVVP